MITETEMKWKQDRLKKIGQYLESEKREDFIDDEKIEDLISRPSRMDKKRISGLIEKARSIKGLTPEETAYLLNIEDKDVWEELFRTARFVKNEVYGNRIVLFAPVYLSNLCVNNCLYCGFRSTNSSMVPQNLSTEEIRKEVEVLTSVGHKRLLAVYGEHPKSDIRYIVDSIRTIYSMKKGPDEIRRVNVNAAPFFIDELKELKAAGIGTYQVFQETYHKATYQKIHPGETVKNSYAWRLFSQHRAQEAGIDDVAIGALFGLYKWKFEVLGLIYHAMSMEKEFGVGSHTISFPRLEPALGTDFIKHSEHLVSDDDFRKVIAILRLAVPYTGLILTARETPEFRREAIRLGISQTDAGTRIAIGGYSQSEKVHIPEKEQFRIADTRSLEDYIYELAEDGYIPSFCTADYRCGRTGCEFMGIVKAGKIKTLCIPNAILTFKEYLLDYASARTKILGDKLIREYTEFVGKNYSDTMAKTIREYLARIGKGERDLYF
ncbi:MAG: [FeFe] hydrogenase H-cluster radical SAM maturase HydG [bacterium]|nr:[FeFe] hydrogenase H-cluster radical SAM maturase HydG [bacterium]